MAWKRAVQVIYISSTRLINLGRLNLRAAEAFFPLKYRAW